jgi:iron complex outermembrane receptor protein
MKHVALRVALFTSVPFQLMAAVPALAQSSTSASADGTIIVTARRIEERLQDVPISISVVDKDRISKANITSSEDLARVVPGLAVDSRYSSEQSSFSIRGFTQQLRTSAAVGTYFGEVVAPRGSGLSLQGGDGAGPGSTFDIQNIQVLKGPQGTLFGRNTTGGAVIITPTKPTDRIEGYLEGSYGNYDMLRIQAVVNLPLADFARLRLGVDRQVKDGYLRNISGIGPRDFSNTDYTALRGSLVLDLSPDLENYTIVSYLKSDNNGSIPQIFNPNPSDLVGFASFARPQVARRAALGDAGRYTVENTLPNPRSRTRQFQAINITKWIASDNITIKNIASYSHFIQDLRQDIFGTAFARAGGYLSTSFSYNPNGSHSSDQKNFTEELQLQGTGGEGRLNYQLGLYYEHSTPGSATAGGAPGIGAVCLPTNFNSFFDSRCIGGRDRVTGQPNTFGTPNSGTIEFINMAAYAQATFAITDRLKATGGIRYTYDRARGSAQGLNALYAPSTPPGQFVAPTIIGCSAGYPAATNCVFTGRTSDKKPTWTMNLQYNFIEDLMVYGTYSRGYKQGGVTPFAAAGVSIYGPEKVDNYEIGAKASFQGSVSGNFNIAGFYSKLRNQQILVGLQDTTGRLPSATSVLNAGKSRASGIEVDASLRFGRFFRIDAAGTYLSTKLNLADPGFPEYDVKTLPAPNGPLEFSPKWSTNLGATVTLPIDESMGRIDIGGAYRYTSSYISGGTGRSTPIKQLDANVTWTDVGGAPVDLSVFGTNLTNQFTYGYVLGLRNQFGFDVGYVGQPRMYGVRLKLRFGEGN